MVEILLLASLWPKLGLTYEQDQMELGIKSSGKRLTLPISIGSSEVPPPLIANEIERASTGSPICVPVP